MTNSSNIPGNSSNQPKKGTGVNSPVNNMIALHQDECNQRIDELTKGLNLSRDIVESQLQVSVHGSYREVNAEQLERLTRLLSNPTQANSTLSVEQNKVMYDWSGIEKLVGNEGWHFIQRLCAKYPKLDTAKKLLAGSSVAVVMYGAYKFFETAIMTAEFVGGLDLLLWSGIAILGPLAPLLAYVLRKRGLKFTEQAHNNTIYQRFALEVNMLLPNTTVPDESRHRTVPNEMCTVMTTSAKLTDKQLIDTGEEIRLAHVLAALPGFAAPSVPFLANVEAYTQYFFIRVSEMCMKLNANVDDKDLRTIPEDSRKFLATFLKKGDAKSVGMLYQVCRALALAVMEAHSKSRAGTVNAEVTGALVGFTLPALPVIGKWVALGYALTYGVRNILKKALPKPETAIEYRRDGSVKVNIGILLDSYYLSSQTDDEKLEGEAEHWGKKMNYVPPALVTKLTSGQYPDIEAFASDYEAYVLLELGGKKNDAPKHAKPEEIEEAKADYVRERTKLISMKDESEKLPVEIKALQKKITDSNAELTALNARPSSMSMTDNKEIARVRQDLAASNRELNEKQERLKLLAAETPDPKDAVKGSIQFQERITEQAKEFLKSKQEGTVGTPLEPNLMGANKHIKKAFAYAVRKHWAKLAKEPAEPKPGIFSRLISRAIGKKEQQTPTKTDTTKAETSKPEAPKAEEKKPEAAKPADAGHEKPTH